MRQRHGGRHLGHRLRNLKKGGRGRCERGCPVCVCVCVCHWYEMWGRAEGGAPISALKHKLSIRGLSLALIWGRTLSHKDPSGGRKCIPRSCQTNTWKKMTYYWLICVLANTSDMLKPSLWPLAIETLRNLIYTSVFFISGSAHYKVIVCLFIQRYRKQCLP